MISEKKNLQRSLVITTSIQFICIYVIIIINQILIINTIQIFKIKIINDSDLIILKAEIIKKFNYKRTKEKRLKIFIK